MLSGCKGGKERLVDATAVASKSAIMPSGAVASFGRVIDRVGQTVAQGLPATTTSSGACRCRPSPHSREPRALGSESPNSYCGHWLVLTSHLFSATSPLHCQYHSSCKSPSSLRSLLGHEGYSVECRTSRLFHCDSGMHGLERKMWKTRIPCRWSDLPTAMARF